MFDLDGTLVTSGLDFPAMKAAVVRLLAEYRVDAERLHPLDILGAVELVCAHEPGRAAEIRHRVDEVLAEWEVTNARRTAELGGSVATLAELRRRGFRVGIVTRNCRAAAEETLRRVPLPHDVLLTRNDVAHAKPHPEHLRRALEALSASPESAVMVGDHWMDVKAGREAGMSTVGILDGRSPDRFAPMPPDILLGHVSDLSTCLDRTGKPCA